MRGTVLGPGKTEGTVLLQFESPGGRWNAWPAQISRTKLAPEDTVCPPALPPTIQSVMISLQSCCEILPGSFTAARGCGKFGETVYSLRPFSNERNRCVHFGIGLFQSAETQDWCYNVM